MTPGSILLSCCGKSREPGPGTDLNLRAQGEFPALVPREPIDDLGASVWRLPVVTGQCREHESEAGGYAEYWLSDKIEANRGG